MARYSSVCATFKLDRNRSGRAAAVPGRLRAGRKRALLLLLALFLTGAVAAKAQAQDEAPSESGQLSGPSEAGGLADASTIDRPTGISLLSHTNSGAPPTAFAGRAPLPWQLTIGYQFNHIDIRGALPPFNTIGVNASLVRYIRSGLGVEAAAGGAYGKAVDSASLGSLFVGAGLHLIYTNRTHFEPWAHGLLGGEHLNFGAPVAVKASSVAWIAGGGFDYRLSPRLALRIQADYLGTHFFGAFQRNFQLVSGVVWNF
jgi:hypothetical protein